MKKTYLLIITLITLVFIFIVIAILFSSFKKPGRIKMLHFTPNPIITTAPVSSAHFILPDSRPTRLPSDYPKGGTEISSLIQRLPYRGTYFSLYYNYSDDIFILFLDKNKSAAGETEFENFLKQNGILDKSWIKNLNQSYQLTIPEL
jgi:hypothetical protein